MSETFAAALTARLQAVLWKWKIDAGGFEVTPAADPRHGDYQANAAMVLAKQLRKPPRDIAAALRDEMDVDGLAETPEVAGAGFLNFRISTEALQARMNALMPDPRLGVEAATSPKTIIVDFSSPNVAKPMHVGHIRSTILGDCLARLARFLGHHVITDNHLGDWGTQFGKVIYGWKHLLDEAALTSDPISELVRLYREVNALEAANENTPEGTPVSSAVRQELVLLQQGDPENRKIWETAVALSRREFEKIYARLDVRFDEYLGESFYNDALAPLVDRLISEKAAEESQGAICIFFPDDPALSENPCIIRKSDGGFLYATTDLATLEYRAARWSPDEIWYVTGAPQQLHFQQVFAAAKRMGIATRLEHVSFGSILGEDRKMMKTRSGENVLLVGLLDEALERARDVIAQKNPELPEAERESIAEAIGIGAIKYAELSQSRMTDYVFSWDKLLSFQGNTAPYLQNAYVRIRSIFRRLETPVDLSGIAPILDHPAERVLALKLSQFAEEVPASLEQFRPNTLANYLYGLADSFHGFYEACPVLRADEPLRASRLMLCELTSRVLAKGLDLLGIRVVEKM